MKSRSLLLWIAALLVTLASAAYQRMTGPTYPLRGSVAVGSEVLKFRLPRSFENPADGEISIAAPDITLAGFYEFRRHPSSDGWTRKPLERAGEKLTARIPSQPAAGKVMYRVFLGKAGADPVPLTADPVMARFKGAVPRLPVLYPHILLMFVGMLCSTRAGLEACFGGKEKYRIALISTVLMFLGGIVLGPLVQKYAFGSFWTGWPVGHDLTDNKTAVAVIIWGIALWRLRRKPETRSWVIFAAVMTLVVFGIPHSVLGSELNYAQTPP